MSCEPPANNIVVGSSSNFLRKVDADNAARKDALAECATHLDAQPTEILIEYLDEGRNYSLVQGALERRRETDAPARAFLERREREAEEQRLREEEQRRREEEWRLREAEEQRQREVAEERRKEDLSGTLTGLAAAMQRMDEAAAATEAAMDSVDQIDCGLSENFYLPECY